MTVTGKKLGTGKTLFELCNPKNYTMGPLRIFEVYNLNSAHPIHPAHEAVNDRAKEISLKMHANLWEDPSEQEAKERFGLGYKESEEDSVSRKRGPQDTEPEKGAKKMRI